MKRLAPVLLSVLLILSIGVNIYLFYKIQQYSDLIKEIPKKKEIVIKPKDVSILPKNKAKSLVNKYLDRRLLHLSYDFGAIKIDNKKYILIVFYNSNLKSKLLEIDDNQAFDYYVGGDLPIAFNKTNSKMTIKDLTNSGVPEFIYQTASGGTGGESKKIWVINIPKRQVAEAEMLFSYDTYGTKEIKLNKIAQENKSYKDYLIAHISKLEFAEENNQSGFKILYQFWYENNGIDCSELRKPCNLKLLWINFPGEQKFFGDWSKATEAQDKNYHVISMFKGGVFLVDKKNNKIALIYLPESEYDFIDDIKLKVNYIDLFRGNNLITYDIRNRKLFKSKK